MDLLEVSALWADEVKSILGIYLFAVIIVVHCECWLVCIQYLFVCGRLVT